MLTPNPSSECMCFLARLRENCGTFLINTPNLRPRHPQRCQHARAGGSSRPGLVDVPLLTPISAAARRATRQERTRRPPSSCMLTLAGLAGASADARCGDPAPVPWSSMDADPAAMCFSCFGDTFTTPPAERFTSGSVLQCGSGDWQRVLIDRVRVRVRLGLGLTLNPEMGYPGAAGTDRRT